VRPAFTWVPAHDETSALPFLCQELGLAEARFDGHDPHGRPRAFASDAPLPVSLSRCGTVCAVALSLGGRVGVDLVDPRAPLPLEALMDLASQGERTWLESLPESPRRRKLFQLWAAREALLKALGLGLRIDPGAVELAPWGEDGLHPIRVLGAGEGWHVEVMAGRGLAEGLVLALAWAE